MVLGCRVLPDGRPSPALTRRLARAAAVYAETGAAWVVVSGGKSWNGQREADVMRRELPRVGVPAPLIVLESRSRSTYENAHFSSQLLLALDFDGLGLVTCDFHMPRAQAAFERYGWQLTPYAATTPAASCWRTHLRDARERAALVNLRLRWD